MRRAEAQVEPRGKGDGAPGARWAPVGITQLFASQGCGADPGSRADRGTPVAYPTSRLPPGQPAHRQQDRSATRRVGTFSLCAPRVQWESPNALRSNSSLVLFVVPRTALLPYSLSYPAIGTGGGLQKRPWPLTNLDLRFPDSRPGSRPNVNIAALPTRSSLFPVAVPSGKRARPDRYQALLRRSKAG